MVKKITKSRIVWNFLNDYGRRYYLREIASLLGKPHQTIKPYIDELVKEKILVRNRKRGVVEYNLNFEERKIYDYLIIAEKEKLIERLNGDMYFKVLFEKCFVFFENTIFIVFGSAVNKILRGSDIDLLVVGKQNVSKAISEFESVCNKKVHKIQIDSMNKLSMSLVKEIYKKHFIFNDTEKVVRFFGGLHEQNKLV